MRAVYSRFAAGLPLENFFIMRRRASPLLDRHQWQHWLVVAAAVVLGLAVRRARKLGLGSVPAKEIKAREKRRQE